MSEQPWYDELQSFLAREHKRQYLDDLLVRAALAHVVTYQSCLKMLGEVDEARWLDDHQWWQPSEWFQRTA